jgi:hypothetical protein
MAVQRGRNERRGEAYPQGYVEPLRDARTKLADFFSILLVFCTASRTVDQYVYLACNGAGSALSTC